jgi:hypothetical protein
MSQETTYHGILGELARLDAALDANAGELPHLEGARLRLASLVSGAEGMAQQRFLVAGQRVATGIRRLLKEHYGINAEKLAEFGLQPFRGRSRRAAPDGQGTPVPPPEVQAPVPGNPE